MSEGVRECEWVNKGGSECYFCFSSAFCVPTKHLSWAQKLTLGDKKDSDMVFTIFLRCFRDIRK